jgi:hypothetical protein
MGFFIETHGLFFASFTANTISSRHCPVSISHEMKMRSTLATGAFTFLVLCHPEQLQGVKDLDSHY